MVPFYRELGNRTKRDFRGPSNELLESLRAKLTIYFGCSGSVTISMIPSTVINQQKILSDQ